MGLSQATAAPLQVYGPGGPAPAMKEAAVAFSQRQGIAVEVTAGPTAQWVEKAKQDADVIFSGAENMMSDFAKALPGTFDLQDAKVLYLRPVAMLVRPGNPKNIRGFRDMLRPGIRIMAVAGAGQTGLWEDVAGRAGNIEELRAFRQNLLLPEAANSAAAKAQWIEQPNIDVWLIWNIWQVANPRLADVVEMDEPYRIYRDVGAVVTRNGASHPEASEFLKFLTSEDGRAIFKKWGWKAD